MEYLFQLKTKGNEEKIQRIIPLIYLDKQMTGPGISFTKALIYESLPTWDKEFKAPDISMGDFLSRQLTRRLQETAVQDERIYNTFANVKLVFRYEKDPQPYFLFSAVAPLREPMQTAYSVKQGIHEDILYLWELAAREFVEVVHSYGFRQYGDLRFEMNQNAGPLVWSVTSENLELFRRHKKKLQDILILTRQN